MPPEFTDTLNFANLWAQVSLSTSTDHAHEYITPDRSLFAEAGPLSTRCNEQSRAHVRFLESRSASVKG